MQRQNNIDNVRSFVQEFDRRLSQSGFEPNAVGARERWDVLETMCRERNVALTILTDHVAYLHKNDDRYCLRAEFSPTGSDGGTVKFEPIELSDEFHTALSQVKETVSQRLN